MTASPRLLLPGAVALALLTAASWWAWMGWDHTYQTDPRTGQASGPYDAWQVVGCVLTLIVLAMIAGVLLRPWLVVAVMPVAFTVSWSVDAARTDETGLWGVGAVLLLLGCLAGAGVLAGLATVVRRRREALDLPEPEE